MSNGQILVLFLKALVAAKKSVGLYPPGSEMAAAWIQRLHGSLDAFLRQGLTFPIRVARDRFAWSGEDILTVDPALEGLRFDLESRGIAEFSIDPEVEDWELRAFLEVLNLPSTSFTSLADAGGQLRTRGVLRVSVAAPAPGAGQDGQRADPSWQVLQTGKDDLDLFVEAVLAATEQRLTDLTYDRTALAAWFQAVADGDQVDALYGALRMLGSMAEGGGDREIRTRTMIEALLDLPEPTLQPLLTKWLIPLAGSDLTAFNLLTQLTEEELGKISRLVPDEQLLALSSELLEFPWEEGKRQRLLEAITLTVRRREEPSAGGPGPALAADDPVLVALRREILDACHPDVLLERSLDILLALVFNVESEEYPAFAVDAIEEIVAEALARGRLELAVRAVSSLGVSTVTGGQKMREHSGRVALFRRRIAGRTQVSLVAGLLRQSASAAQVGHAAEYLRLAAREGIEEFTALLAYEKDRRVRARMCQVLASVGPPIVPVLLPWLEDSRWYVIRNIVYILGRIGHESAFSPVTGMLDHAHPRVRLEAVRSLARIGGPAAAGPIGRCVGDQDPAVRLAVVKALGSLGSDEAVPTLRDLATRPPSRAGEVEMRQEAIAALAALGTPFARLTLEKLAGRRVWFWQRTERRLKALAAGALARAGSGGAPGGEGEDGD